MMLRIEAGLPLIDVEFHTSRLAFTDARAGHAQGARLRLDAARASTTTTAPFIGRDAIRRELADGRRAGPRVGLVVDWQDWDRLHRDAGLLPPKDETPAAPTSRCCTTTTATAGRLRHQLHVLPGAAAPHRDGPGAARPRRGRAPRSTSR